MNLVILAILLVFVFLGNRKLNKLNNRIDELVKTKNKDLSITENNSVSIFSRSIWSRIYGEQ